MTKILLSLMERSMYFSLRIPFCSWHRNGYGGSVCSMHRVLLSIHHAWVITSFCGTTPKDPMRILDHPYKIIPRTKTIPIANPWSGTVQRYTCPLLQNSWTYAIEPLSLNCCVWQLALKLLCIWTEAIRARSINFNRWTWTFQLVGIALFLCHRAQKHGLELEPWTLNRSMWTVET